jgi:hypothetical protein
MISVQNFVLRSISLTLNTTCPIFLILMGLFSLAIGSSFCQIDNSVADGLRNTRPIMRPRQPVVYHGKRVKAKHQIRGGGWIRFLFDAELRDQFSLVFGERSHGRGAPL